MSFLRRTLSSKDCRSHGLGKARRPARLFGQCLYARSLRIEPLEDRSLLSVGTASDYDSLQFGPVCDSSAQTSCVATNTVEIAPLVSGSASPSSAYTPEQIRTAYGIDSITVGSLVGNGAGQTIAIISVYDNPKFVSNTDVSFLSSDLHQFDAYFGLSDPPSFRKLDQNGGTNYPSFAPVGTGTTMSWATETALDVEWAHAIAPQANIVLIEANSALTLDIIAAIDTARNLPGVSVISLSGGWTEDQLTAANEQSMDSHFTTPAGHQGITFVAATGDHGSPGTYPAYSQNVLAVGGTSLSSTYYTETGWSGSGGGQSTFTQEPSYQQTVQSSGYRQSPDVAFVGDPNTGVAVYDSYDFGSSSPWIQSGGTSLSAPCWAGLIAIANQIRADQGLGSLDGPSQTIPALYALPVDDFCDITSGSNGDFSAGVGYDNVTGLGTPVANLLVPDLASLKKATPPTVTSTTPTLTSGILTATYTQLSIAFSSSVLGGDTATNYELRSLGADGLLGTADDVTVPFTLSYSNTTATLSFSALPASVYRLTIHDTITDTRSNKLDGNGDGKGGDDWASDFVVLTSAGLFDSVTSPHFIAFNIATGGFGTGEIVRGGSNGVSNAFNGYGRLIIDGATFTSSSSSSTTDNGQSVLTGNGTFSGLTVSREITVPNTGTEDFARTVDSFTNSTGAAITTTVKIVGNLGSDTATTVFATSDGDNIVEAADQWFGTDGNGTSAVIHFIHGRAGLKPSSVEVVGDNVQWTYTITVQPGKTVDLAYFTIVGSTRAEAIAAANALVSKTGFVGQAAAFLSSTETAALSNFQFPPSVPVTINQGTSQADPTNSKPINYTVVFGEAMTDFSSDDVTLSGTAGATTATVTPVGTDGTTYNVAVGGMTRDGTVIASIAADVAHSVAGGDNLAATSTDSTVTYKLPDTTPPTVTINQASGQADPTSAATINFTVTFSESVTDFATGDVTLSGTAGATTAIVTGSGTTYNVAVSGMTGSGTVIASIAAEVAHDTAGNVNAASTSTDNTVAYRLPPTIAKVVVAEAGTIKNGKLESNENLKITWAASSANGIASQTMKVDGRAITPINGPYSNLYYSCPIGTLAVGSHTYTITSTDAKGISSTSTGEFTVVASAAVAPVAGSPSIASVVVAEAGTTKNGKLESNENLKITWAASSANGIASQTITVDGRAITPINGPYSGLYYSCQIGTRAAGSHTYMIASTNSKGVSSTSTGEFTVVASTAIAPVVGSPSIASIVVAEAGATKNGKFESNENIKITWAASSKNGIASQVMKVDGKVVTPINGPYSGLYYSCQIGTRAAGNHTYMITSTDSKGVSSISTGEFTVVASTIVAPVIVAPSITSVVVAEAGTTKNGNLESNEGLKITWAASSKNGIASQTMKIDGKAVKTINGPYSGLYYSCPIGIRASGVHTYTITSTDAKGISSMSSGSFTIVAPVTTGSKTAVSMAAVSRADLLAAVMYEMDQLGQDDSSSDDLMDATLPSGTRRTLATSVA